MIRRLCLVLIVALCLTVPSNASAYWPYMGYGGFGGWGNGWGGGWGWNSTTQYRPAPPYFALYPPVYYSPHIQARHYGASPFAWSGGMEPIMHVPSPMPMSAAEPMMVENPYVSGAARRAAATGELRPLKMDNPFVVSVDR
jgi:hypothetical protein